jgi:hypothetical protein
MLVIVLAAGAARADRPVTPEERASIAAVLEAEGCTGGEYEHEDDDDEAYEVDDARCADGPYDFELSRDFQILKRDRED